MKLKPWFLSLPFLALAAALARAEAPAAPAPVAIKQSAREPWLISSTLPVGAYYQVLYEDPDTHAIELLVRFPSGYKIPAHYHSKTETIFIVKGSLELGAGGKVSVLKPGDSAVIPAQTPITMAVRGWGSCEFLSSFNGPFDVKGLPSPL